MYGNAYGMAGGFGMAPMTGGMGMGMPSMDPPKKERLKLKMTNEEK